MRMQNDDKTYRFAIGNIAERANQSAITNLVAELDRLCTVKEAITSELDSVEDLIATLTRFIAILSDEELPDATLQIDAADEVLCGKATVADIAHCSSQRQALYVIAERNDGVLMLNAASALIVAAGKSRSTARIVSGSLHSFLSQSNDFEWIGPSVFRLKEATLV